MTPTLSRLSVLAIVAIASPALADLTVGFREGAPKDRFTFRNDGGCTIKDARLVLDLSGSKAGLIFDVTGAGAGVEVFQPLELVSGADTLRAVPTIRDGDNRVEFAVAELPPGGVIAFTIDVDDTAGGREITVSGSEIEAASVSLASATGQSTAQFTSKASAVLPLKGC